MTHPGHTATEDGSMAHDAEPTAPTEPTALVRPAGGSLRPVAVLAVGSFAMGTDSFVLAGILPNIAGGLHVSTAAAGQTITVFALTYALAAPLLAGITGALPRKPLMLAALGMFVLANLASAAAPSLGLLLAARVAAGLGAALYTPNASAAATALVEPATLLLAITTLTVTLAALTVATSVPVVFVVMAVNGAAAWAVATPNNHRLTALAPALPGVVISLNSSGIYLGQALGAAAGGLLLDHQLTPDLLPLVGAALGVVALTAHLLTLRRNPRPVEQTLG